MEFVCYKGPGLSAIIANENHDIAIARSSSSPADPGLKMAFKYLNV